MNEAIIGDIFALLGSLVTLFHFSLSVIPKK